jgi:hypothetical protein
MSLRTLTRASAVLLILGAPIGACGKLGQLEKPGPLSASPTPQPNQPAFVMDNSNRPVDTIDARDIFTDPAPPRTLPIPGTGPDPDESAPPGALPDPYANPR